MLVKPNSFTQITEIAQSTKVVMVGERGEREFFKQLANARKRNITRKVDFGDEILSSLKIISDGIFFFPTAVVVGLSHLTISDERF